MNKWILISTNDFYAPDNIQGRIQSKIYNTYEDAYNTMKDSVLNYVEEDRKELVSSGIEFTDVALGEYNARSHRDNGELNNYWKIIEVKIEAE